MLRRWIGNALKRGGEAILAIALVLAFFLAFMGLLSLVFPAGTSLADLMRSEGLIGGGPARAGSSLGLDHPADVAGPVVAVLSNVRRQVKDKPADAVAWSDARAGLKLGSQHAVQTAERSQATIRFSESGEMVLDENSLVILKRADLVPSENRRRASVIVIGGTLRAHLVAGRAEALTIEVETGTETARLRSDASPGKAADIAVRVNDDRSSTFSVLTGGARVSSERGTVAIAPNQSVTVDPRGLIGPVLPLPPAPRSIEPAPGSSQSHHSSRARVAFRWSAPEGTDGWRIAVARDPGFKDVVADERVAEPAFTLGNLRAGRYYWRVRSLHGDLEGPDGATRDFILRQDRRPPELSVSFPEGVVLRAEIILGGRTEPGTRVFVGEEEARVDAAGRFTITLRLKRGVNIVVVQAEDDIGNVTYRSRVVNASY
jgi:hypothetical protein